MPTSPDGSIVLDGIWKRFRADRRRPLLMEEIDRLSRAVRRQERLVRWRWVLRDIGAHIVPGEAVGLMGTNGSGKSTLLKILNQTMFPYAGRVGVHGRVGALIEVTAGIHPILSGRENVYLYGSLLGLSRADVAARFDDIVEFAELSGAIDRQVKFYSSGMQMRLGFSVAAFLEPDILLVDEVLAVGDSVFQQKCLGRMREVLQQGTTLILVSHDLISLESVIRRGIWLRDGAVAVDGPARAVLGEYRAYLEGSTGRQVAQGPVRIDEATIRAAGHGGREAALGGGELVSVPADEPVTITLVLASDRRERVEVQLGISEGSNSTIFTVRQTLDLPLGKSLLTCGFDGLPLARGRYSVWAGVYAGDGKPLAGWQPVTAFEVTGAELPPAPMAVIRLAPLVLPARWKLL
ncbi:MAG: ABC transporter ATP-binding protein [Actinomycetes bacterium]